MKCMRIQNRMGKWKNGSESWAKLGHQRVSGQLSDIWVSVIMEMMTMRVNLPCLKCERKANTPKCGAVDVKALS